MFDGIALPGLRTGSPSRLELDPADPINQGLFGFWPMLDGGGALARDIGPRGRHGTFSGAVSRSAARWGRAPLFSRSAPNFVRTTVLPTTQKFSAMFWIMGAAASGTSMITQPFVTEENNGGPRIGFSWDHSSGSYNQGFFTYNGGAYPVAKLTTALGANTPYLLGCTYDGATLTVFCNGRPENSVAAGTLGAAGSDQIAFGGTTFNSGQWDGRLGMARVWTRCLTLAEMRRPVSDIFAGTFAPEDRLLIGWRAGGAGTPYTAEPGAGSLTLAGQAPTVTAEAIVAAGAGTLTLAGQTPTITASATVSIGAGAIVWQGATPTPSAAASVAVGAGSLALAGQAPTATGAALLEPGPGAIAWQGLAPGITAAALVTPGAGTITWQGLQPTAGSGLTVTPGTGSLVWAGAAPTVTAEATVQPGAGGLTWAGSAPSPTAGMTISPGYGSLVWQGHAPSTITVSFPASATVTLGARTWTVTLPRRTWTVTLAPRVWTVDLPER